MWFVVALAAVVGNLVLFWSLRGVAREVGPLRDSARRLARLAVATDDTRTRIAQVVPEYRTVRPRLRAALRPTNRGRARSSLQGDR